MLRGYDEWKTTEPDWDERPEVEPEPDMEPPEGWGDCADWAWCVWAEACISEQEAA
jgi:hypothetical protein